MADENAMWQADPVPVGWRTCAICGAEGLDIRPSLARLAMPDGTIRYDDVMRCKDVGECWQRCTAAGLVWPLA
jgi:hypothetical protein